MDTKEAIEILAKMQNYDSERNVEALEIAISALEKVPVLETENARLINLLNNANQTLKRAGSSTQFHLKANEMLAETIIFEEKEHPEDVFVEQYIEELNQEIKQLQAENARLREKETPQKPKEKPQGGIIKCPVCGEFINWYAHFCWNCGQAIKIDKE